ncbi:hypothetical protein [Haloferula sp. A504]|uniref:hypothetical protein n=1 Tax=Haloferula sp. A504 TaxID=3373601 RepID=UPI0031CA4C05|nr:hypothetical protein [Verrucomicrobiaceae bacterium E54]
MVTVAVPVTVITRRDRAPGLDVDASVGIVVRRPQDAPHVDLPAGLHDQVAGGIRVVVAGEEIATGRQHPAVGHHHGAAFIHSDLNPADGRHRRGYCDRIPSPVDAGVVTRSRHSGSGAAVVVRIHAPARVGSIGDLGPVAALAIAVNGGIRRLKTTGYQGDKQKSV